MSQKPLSLRAYAQHRKEMGFAGGSLQAVQRAIASERISYVMEDGRKKIPDPDAADREWATNTDLSRGNGSALDDPGTEDPGEPALDEDGNPIPTMATSSATEKKWKAKLTELAYRERAGELVDKAEMLAQLEDTFGTIRTKLLGLPSKAKQKLPHLTLDDLATIEDVVREALEELSRIEPSEESGA